MRNAVLCVFVSMVSLSHTSLLGADGSEAINSIAKILLDFTHVPSPSQKATLQVILDNNTKTAAEQVLARALMNVEHLASPEDKPKLEALIRDESAPRAIKTLAIILNNFTHTPTEVDKKKLRQLLEQFCGGGTESRTPSGRNNSTFKEGVHAMENCPEHRFPRRPHPSSLSDNQ